VTTVVIRLVVGACIGGRVQVIMPLALMALPPVERRVGKSKSGPEYLIRGRIGDAEVVSAAMVRFGCAGKPGAVLVVWSPAMSHTDHRK